MPLFGLTQFSGANIGKKPDAIMITNKIIEALG